MRYRFADFTADSELFELRRGDEGVPLEPKVLKLLLFLLENPDRSLTKEEIFAAVWPGVHVAEDSLTRAVSLLRRALGDPVLRTVRGRGYRIGVPVQLEVAVPRPVAKAGSALLASPADAFVGRADLLEQLSAAWQEVGRLRRGRVVLLAGPAGIGKTRLSEELAAILRDRGARVLQAWCDDGEGVPPFWPWVQLLRGYRDAAGAAAFETALGPGAADLVELLPGQRPVSVERAPRSDSERDRFRLYDGLARFLCRAAATQPLFVAIDDLHWADRSSLRALVFAAREIRDAPILLLGTYRDEELALDRRVGEGLAALVRQPGALRVSVPALSAEEVALLAESLLGERPSREQVGELWERTGGNPLFVRELALWAREGGALQAAEGDRSAWHGSLPPGFRGLLHERLDRRSPPCRTAMEQACMLGLRFHFELLQAVAELERGELLDALEEAVSAGILAEAERGGGYAFAHALVRDALRESLGPSQRLELHARTLDALEKLHGHELDAVAGELAEHALALARAGGDFGKALLYATRAAETAAARLAFDEAALHYGRALEALEHQQPVDAVRRCDLLLAWAEALWQAGHRSHSSELFLEAARAARGLRDAGRLARAALGFADRFVEHHGAIDQAKVGLLEEALSGLGPAATPLRIRLLVKLAVHLCNAGELERAGPLLDEAVALARSAGAPGLEALALRAQAWLRWCRDDAEQALALATQARGLAEQADEPFVAAEAQLLRIAALMALGEVAGSEPEVERLARQIEEHRLLVLEHFLISHRAGRAALAGRFDEAERLAEQALACGERVESRSATGQFLAQLHELRRAQGRLPEVASRIEVLPSTRSWIVPWNALRILLCHIHAELGRIQEACQEFEALAEEGFARIPRGPSWLVLVAELSETCAWLGDAARARELYELLLPYDGLNIVLGYAQFCLAPASRYLGLLASTLERWDEGERHFEAALALNVRIGAAPLLARTQFDYARMLLARGGTGDRARARELLAPALVTARELGMPSLEEEAVAAEREAALP